MQLLWDCERPHSPLHGLAVSATLLQHNTSAATVLYCDKFRDCIVRDVAVIIRIDV